MSRLHFLSSSILGALGGAMVPVTALLVFSTSDYGAFSVTYLVFALGWSMTLSTICDAWVRGRSEIPGPREWEGYSGALFSGAVLAGLAALFVTGIIAANWGNALAGAVGVTANIYRLGARFFHSASRGPRAALVSDALGILVFSLAVVGTLTTHLSPLTGVLLGWGFASITSSALFPPPKLHARHGLRAWVRKRHSRIKPLLAESLLMDAGAIGTPLVMAPLLGAGSFGAYRSISSAAVPIQLSLDPLRPNIVQISAERFLSRQVVSGVLAATAAMASACFIILGLILPQIPGISGSLAALAHYAVPCSVYVVASFPGYFYYILSRRNLSHSLLVKGRLLQTLMHISAPLGGLFLGGLDGAVWGFVCANVAAAPVWPVLLLRQNRARPVPTESQRQNRPL